MNAKKMAAFREETVLHLFRRCPVLETGNKGQPRGGDTGAGKIERQRSVVNFVICRNEGAIWYAGCYFSGITTTSSLGMTSSVALSIPRWAITRSGGVWVSHSDKARSW